MALPPGMEGLLGGLMGPGGLEAIWENPMAGNLSPRNPGRKASKGQHPML